MCRNFLLALVLVISIAVAENMVRVFQIKHFNPALYMRYRLDDDLIYSFTPNQSTEWITDDFDELITTNNLGFRGRNISFTKRKDTIRVIAIGDSYTAGHGISTNEKTYPNDLEVMLNNGNPIQDKKIEVVNAGTPGYSPDQEYRLILKRIVNLNPDIIIWNLNVWDMEDLMSVSPPLYAVKNGTLVPLSAKYNWLYLQNYLFVYVPRWIQKSYIFDLFQRTLPKIAYVMRKKLSPGEEALRAKNKLSLEIRTIHALGTKNNFRLIVTFLPYKKDERTVTADNYMRILEEVQKDLAKDNITVVNLKEKFDEVTNPKDTIIAGADNSLNTVLGVTVTNIHSPFFPTDFHPNEAGASVIASLIVEYMFGNNFIKE